MFHCATPSPLSSDRKLFHKVNYEGTLSVIEACRQQNVSVRKSLCSLELAGVTVFQRKLKTRAADYSQNTLIAIFQRKLKTRAAD